MKNREIALRHNAAPAMVANAESVDRYSVPVADIYETPEAYVLMLDMPGASKESISVKLDKNELTVKSSVTPMHPEHATVVFRELEMTGYYREFSLGEGIDRDTVDAHFDNGVLTIKLFKRAELKPRSITIH
jgi:HSP20 family molecular chaperone IbpA